MIRKLQDLPDDVMQTIVSYLHDFSSIRLMETCRKLHEYGRRNGYLKMLKLTESIKGCDFLNLWCTHIHTIDRVIIHKQENPHLWVVEFPRILKFFDCDFTLPITTPDGEKAKTSILFITTKSTVFINWEVFPNLKLLLIQSKNSNDLVVPPHIIYI